MFDRCISFHVSYFPEEARLVVGCLNAPDCTLTSILGVDADSHSVSLAAAQGISSFVSDHYFDFFEVK